MIKITEQYNIKCLKCSDVPEKLVKIGVYYMCYKCFIDEFGKITEIKLKNELSKATYHKWLEIYFKD